MRKVFYLAAGKLISDNSLAARIPSSLARRSFLIVVAIAMAGGLMRPAYANGCEKLKKKLADAQQKKGTAEARARGLQPKGEQAMKGPKFKEFMEATKEVAKWDKEIRQIQEEMGEIEMCSM